MTSSLKVLQHKLAGDFAWYHKQRSTQYRQHTIVLAEHTQLACRSINNGRVVFCLCNNSLGYDYGRWKGR